MEPIIQLRGLTKTYGTHKAVDGLDLDINRGEMFGLLGPNGAGKTTTILMMLGLTEPDSGSIMVCGEQATRNPIAVKRKVGYMPDSVGFYPQMSGLENLVYMGSLNGIAEEEVRERAMALMDTVGLKSAASKPAATYSRGMKQRLGLAEVLIKEPELIILDEPTLGIDPTGVKEFLALIKTLQKQQGLTVVLSSHHLHHVQQVCDRVGIFVGGKLLAQGNLTTLAGQLFGQTGIQINIRLTRPPENPAELHGEFSQWDLIDTLNIDGDLLNFSARADITPQIIRKLIESGADISQAQQLSYGLDEIYQKYFESSSNTDTENDNRNKRFLFRPGKKQ